MNLWIDRHGFGYSYRTSVLWSISCSRRMGISLLCSRRLGLNLVSFVAHLCI